MANENILAANTELGFKYEIQRDLIREFQIAFRQKSFAQTEISTCGDTGFASFGGSCVTYHGLFPTLEMLNMASSARHNPELFLQSLANHFPGNSPVVWIPAAATPRLYDMIRFVKPDALVFNTDICATPVCTIPFSNPKDIERGVYAGYVLDVLKSPFAELFDVIATDAFLTRFSKEDRVKVLQIFYKALKPGGVLLTTVRNPKVGESSPLQLTEIENKDSHNYSEKVLIAYRKLVRRAGNPSILPYYNEDELIFATNIYRQKMRSAHGDVWKIEDDLSKIGFESIHTQTSRKVYDITWRTYKQIVAIKPEKN